MTLSKKNIALLGSTGSIGRSSIEVIEALADRCRLVAATSHTNAGLLAQQARRLHIPRVALTNPALVDQLENDLHGTDTEVLAGPEQLEAFACDPDIDILIVAVVGAAALPAVLAAARAGKTIAIANKEALVVAGSLVMPLAKKHNATILPVDSEHSAILQAMHAGEPDEVEKIIITCSGGPFRDTPGKQLAHVSLQDALDHPTWSMGPKITIDSASLMNKALEIIEARWLFDLDADRIEVLIHPESIIHSLVEFRDGSVIAQLSEPDMKLPIQYALTYPQRLPGPAKRLNMQQLGRLTFLPPDTERFPALALGFDVARRDGTAGAVFNAANEAAVDAFRAEKIPFTGIAELVGDCLRKHEWIENPDLQQLLDADSWARQQIAAHVNATSQHART